MNSGDLLLSLVFKKKTKVLEGIILKLSNLKREQDIAIGLAGIVEVESVSERVSQ